MKRTALVFTLILTVLALTGCGVKKQNAEGKTLLGAHLDFKSVPSRHGDGKSLDIDAGVTVDGQEFGFVTSANGSYVKGVKGMDPATRGELPQEQAYDPMAEPQAQTSDASAPQSAPGPEQQGQ